MMQTEESVSLRRRVTAAAAPCMLLCKEPSTPVVPGPNVQDPIKCGNQILIYLGNIDHFLTTKDALHPKT